jgi:hypothetical protein
MNPFLQWFLVLLWAIGGIIVAAWSRRVLQAFLLSAALALPGICVFWHYYGPLDSAGTGQAVGAGLYGALLHIALRIYRGWRSTAPK